MLVLSRKVGEKIMIDGNISVEIVKINGNRITLGIDAPREVRVLRGELDPQSNRKELPTKMQTIELVVEDGLLVAC